MNKELEQLYAQYSQVNDISRDVFLNSYEQFGDTYINFIQESLKKKGNSQETPSSSSGLGENQPTPISAQGNPQITSVPISQDLDLNQSQIEEDLDFRSFYAGYMEGYLDSEMDSIGQDFYVEEGDMNENNAIVTGKQIGRAHV